MIYNVPVKIAGQEVGTAKVDEEVGDVEITFKHPDMVREFLGLQGQGYDSHFSIGLVQFTGGYDPNNDPKRKLYQGNYDSQR